MIKAPDVTLLYVMFAFIVSYAVMKRFLFRPLGFAPHVRRRGTRPLRSGVRRHLHLDVDGAGDPTCAGLSTYPLIHSYPQCAIRPVWRACGPGRARGTATVRTP